MLFSEHMYCVAITFKMTEWVEQRICIKFCIKPEHSSTETIRMLQKATAMGNWWLAASSRQHACSCIMSGAEIFHETSNHPGDSAPLQSRFGTLWLLAFPKIKITFEREEIFRPSMRFTKIRWCRLAELCEVPRYLPKGTEVSLSYVQSFLNLVSCSINVSSFHIPWLDTFWTGLYWLVLS